MLLFNLIFNSRLKWIAVVQKIDECEELFVATKHWKFDDKIPISFKLWWPVLDLFICWYFNTTKLIWKSCRRFN